MINYRPYKKDVIPYLVKWLNNPRVNRLLGESGAKKTTLAMEKKWYANYLKAKNKKFFTINDGRRPIGFMGLKEINRISRKAELFIAIGEDDCRGRGIGTRAVRWITNYGFKKLKLHKIELGVFADNKCAVNCYRDAGLKIEGRQKDDAFFGGKYHDTILMAIFNK